MLNTRQLLAQEGKEQRAEATTMCGVLQREANWKCFILTALICTCLSAITWCRLTEVTKVIINFSVYPIKSTRQMSPCDDGYIYIPVAFMTLLYLVYLVECWHCTARIQLGCHTDLSGVVEKVRRMREASPIVWWKAVCYHYVRRKRQVTRNRYGDAYTASQVYYERVNSHTAAARFHFTFAGVRDISKNLILDVRKPITKFKFTKSFAFANYEAASEFEEQRARFFTEQERFDDYMEMREGLDMAGTGTFRESVVAYADADHRPWYAGATTFWLASCLLMSWPLRMVLEYNTAHVQYRITKLFGVNYMPAPICPAVSPQPPPPPPPPPPAPEIALSRGVTIDSDLEFSHLATDIDMVPSYSEALLMDTAVLLEPEASTQAQRPVPKMPRSQTTQSRFADVVVSVERTRRSWAGIFGSRTSLYQTVVPISDGEDEGLIYSEPLAETCAGDPYGGREVTTPTEDPPGYEEALKLPILIRLRESLGFRDEGGERARRERGNNLNMETSL